MAVACCKAGDWQIRPHKAKWQDRPSGGSGWQDVQEKPLGLKLTDRTKTDTGRRDEKSKALGRTLVKELCKMAP